MSFFFSNINVMAIYILKSNYHKDGGNSAPTATHVWLSMFKQKRAGIAEMSKPNNIFKKWMSW